MSGRCGGRSSNEGGAVDQLVGVQDVRGVVVLHWRGELDISTVPALESACPDVFDYRVDAVVVHTASVTFVDCAAVHVLLALAGACRDAHVPLVLSAPAPCVRRLLRLLDLQDSFTVVDSLAAAFAQVGVSV